MRRNRVIIINIVLILAFLLTPAIDRKKNQASGYFDASPFGVLHNYERVGNQFDISASQELGVGVTRFHIPWYAVEQSEGQWDFTLVDDLISKNSNAGIGMLVTLLSNSTWATTMSGGMGTFTSSPPRDVVQYEEFVRTTVNRYKDKVKYWQIENEISLDRFWSGTTEEYINLLKSASAAIKQADPQAKVVLSGFPDGIFRLIEDGNQEAASHFDYMMSAGGNSFDVIDFHQYYDPESSVNEIQIIRAAFQKYGYDKEIISTEAGDLDVRLFENPNLPIVADLMSIPVISSDFYLKQLGGFTEQEIGNFVNLLKSNSVSRPILEKYQAESLVKRYALSLSRGATQVHWVGMKDEATLVSDWFQMMQCLLDSDGRKKPHYYTYKLMIEKLSGYLWAEELQVSPRLIKFNLASGKSVYVAWNDTETIFSNLGSKIASGDIKVTHIITGSNSIPVTEIIPVNSLVVNRTPVFIETLTDSTPPAAPSGFSVR